MPGRRLEATKDREARTEGKPFATETYQGDVCWARGIVPVVVVVTEVVLFVVDVRGRW